MNDWVELDRALGAIAASGSVEVREDGEWLAGFHAIPLRDSRQGAHSLSSSLVRRPEPHPPHRGRQGAIRKIGCARSAAIRQARGLAASNSCARSGAAPRRADFARTVSSAHSQRILSESFPDATFESLSDCAGPEAFFLRPVRPRPNARVFWRLGVAWRSSGESFSSRSQSRIWDPLARLAASRAAAPAGPRAAPFVPEGAGLRIRERALALSSAARTEIFEFCERKAACDELDSADVGNLESWLVPRPEMESLLAAARETRRAFRRSLNGVRRRNERSDRAAHTARSHEAAFSFRGLEFARWSTEGSFFRTWTNSAGRSDQSERTGFRTPAAPARTASEISSPGKQASALSKGAGAMARNADSRRSHQSSMRSSIRATSIRRFPALTAGDRGFSICLESPAEAGSW